MVGAPPWRDHPVVRACLEVGDRRRRNGVRRHPPTPVVGSRGRELERLRWQAAPRDGNDRLLDRGAGRKEGGGGAVADHRRQGLPLQIGILPAEGVRHPLGEVEGVRRAPRTGTDAEEVVLEGEIAGTERDDPGIDPLGLRFEGVVDEARRVECPPERIGQGGEAELPHLPVEGECRSPNPFGEGALGGVGLQVELEETVPGMQPSERAPSIEVGLGKDLGNTAPIDRDLDGCAQSGKVDPGLGGRRSLVRDTPDPGDRIEEGAKGGERPQGKGGEE